MCKEEGGEIPASALIVTCASGFRKDRWEMSRPNQFLHGGGEKKDCKSCPSEKCEVKEV